MMSLGVKLRVAANSHYVLYMTYRDIFKPCGSSPLVCVSKLFSVVPGGSHLEFRTVHHKVIDFICMWKIR